MLRRGTPIPRASVRNSLNSFTSSPLLTDPHLVFLSHPESSNPRLLSKQGEKTADNLTESHRILTSQPEYDDARALRRRVGPNIGEVEVQ